MLSPFFKTAFFFSFSSSSSHVVNGCGSLGPPSAAAGAISHEVPSGRVQKKGAGGRGEMRSRVIIWIFSSRVSFFTGKKRKTLDGNGRDFSLPPPSAAAALRLGENGVCAILWGGGGEGGRAENASVAHPSLPQTREGGKKYRMHRQKRKKTMPPSPFPTSLQQTNSDEPTGETRNSIYQNINIYCCRKVLSLKSLMHYTLSEIVSNCKSSLSAATCESGEERKRKRGFLVHVFAFMLLLLLLLLQQLSSLSFSLCNFCAVASEVISTWFVVWRGERVGCKPPPLSFLSLSLSFSLPSPHVQILQQRKQGGNLRKQWSRVFHMLKGEEEVEVEHYLGEEGEYDENFFRRTCQRKLSRNVSNRHFKPFPSYL